MASSRELRELRHRFTLVKRLTSRYRAHAMRVAWGLVVLLGCACGPRGTRVVGDIDGAPASLPTAPPLTADEQALLTTLARDGGLLHWRVRDAQGPRCEPWRFTPDPEDPQRGHLVHSDGPVRLRFAHDLADGRLRLHTPQRERDLVTTPGRVDTTVDTTVGTTVATLPCVFSAMSLTPAGQTTPRQFVLTSHERWFFTAEACAAAGPDVDPQPPAPGELHPLGCPSALADPGTRAREDSPAPQGPAARRLHASKRLYWLRRRGARLVCETWRHEPDDQPQRGLLRYHDGARTTVYGYVTGPAVLTLIGPHESRRVRGRAGPTELARAHGCLLTRPFTQTAEALRFGADAWYLRRRDCEHARQAGHAPQPDPDCGPSSP